MTKKIYSGLTGILLAGIMACGFSAACLAQATQVKSSGSLTVSNWSTGSETGPLSPTSVSGINNSGTIILKGNLDNQNGSQTNLGTGTFQFAGSSAQTITGQNLLNNVIVNNSAGLVIGGNTEIDGQLTLTSGRVILGSNNLLLGPSATVLGTLNASNMIVPTGTGQLQKQFTGNGNFTFPVGDNTGTAEYSPVLLTFSSGTYGSGAYAGVKLVDDTWPGLVSPDISRYWTVSQNNITNFSCNAQFNYLSADVTGTETNIYAIRVDPNLATYSAANAGSHYLTANSLTSFGTFTGGQGAMQTGSLTAFLQGPYNVTNHNMNTALTTLPLGDRSDNSKFPTNQPYNVAPWSYSGTESVASLPANTVDWVLVELRHAASPGAATISTVLAKRAAFLLSNGSIVDLDGSSLKFTNLTPFNDNLYIVIWHRNHMAIMANNAVTKDANQVYNYDYSTGSDKIWGGTAGCKQIDSSPVRWGMYGADANSDGYIFLNDYTNYWIPTYFNLFKYIPADFNMDTFVMLNDYTDYWIPNYFKFNPLP